MKGRSCLAVILRKGCRGHIFQLAKDLGMVAHGKLLTLGFSRTTGVGVHVVEFSGGEDSEFGFVIISIMKEILTSVMLFSRPNRFLRHCGRQRQNKGVADGFTTTGVCNKRCLLRQSPIIQSTPGDAPHHVSGRPCCGRFPLDRLFHYLAPEDAYASDGPAAIHCHGLHAGSIVLNQVACGARGDQEE